MTMVMKAEYVCLVNNKKNTYEILIRSTTISIVSRDVFDDSKLRESPRSGGIYAASHWPCAVTLSAVLAIRQTPV